MQQLLIASHYKRVGLFCNIKDCSRSPDKQRRGQEGTKNHEKKQILTQRTQRKDCFASSEWKVRSSEEKYKRKLTTEEHRESQRKKTKGLTNDDLQFTIYE